jgi:hypothetical protein
VTMVRQRLRLRGSPVELVGRLVLVLFALALVWYGGMLLLLALDVDPSTVNDLSGYRSIFDWAADIDEPDVTGDVRLVTGLAGLSAFLVFGYLCLKQLPRPYLARSDVRLGDERNGVTDISPRAIERVAELAANRHSAVTSARGRLEDETVVLELHSSRGRALAETLRHVQRDALEAMKRHELQVRTVDVTLTGFDIPNGRDLR